jgi:nucleoside 2-deoxyribosyltransferase
MTHIYVAGPLFNTHERDYLEKIATRLEENGYTTFLPHRDAGLLDPSQPMDRTKIFRADLAALNTCQVCVALLTGADHDSGTCGELGYMYARGHPCIGVTDDRRWLNNLIWGLCGEGKHIASTLDEMVVLVQRLFPLSSV